MASASAQLLVSVNGGAPASGGHTTTDDSATIALSAVSKVGWGNPPTKWQIASFPSGFACPAGWSTVTTTIAEQAVTVYQYVGNGDPPAFDLPGGGWWGKLLFRLVVLGGATSTLVDELCGVEVRSPNGVRDIAFLEAGQFDAARRAAGPLQANLRKLEDALAAGGGGDVVDFTAVNAALATADATIDVNSQEITGVADGTLPSSAINKGQLDAALATAEAYTDAAVAGVGGAPSRVVAIDANDIIEWKLDDLGTPWLDTLGNVDLVGYGGGAAPPIVTRGGSMHGDRCILAANEFDSGLESADTGIGDNADGTVHGWFRPMLESGLVVSKDDTWPNEALRVWLGSYGNGYELCVNIGDSGNIIVNPYKYSATMRRGEWTHLAVTWTGGVGRVYVDGMQLPTALSYSAISWGGGKWRLGKSYGLGNATGFYSRWRVCDVARSAAYIDEVYRRAVGRWP